MSPFANVYLAMVAGVTAMGALVGILGGAVVWNTRANVVLGALLTGAAYVLALAVVEGPRLVFRLGGFGVFPLTMSFLFCYLTARQLQVRNRLHPVWATLAGIGVALVALQSLGFLFRVRDSAPSLAAFVVTIFLVGVLIWDTRRRPGSS